MAASARIDELRTKFDDNPRRFFAPLANEYRKAGDLSTAIAICRVQLRQFPDHMSGHVVLGQALYEAGELPEAREVFRRAIALDPENLIALRHLGDIAYALGDRADAHGWFRRVLDTDPYNEQIASLVAETAGPAPVEPQPIDAPLPPELEVSPRGAPEPESELTEAAASWQEADPGAKQAAESTATAAESFEFVDDWTLPELEPATDESRTPEVDQVVGLDLPPVHDAALPELAALDAIELEPLPRGEVQSEVAEPAVEPIADAEPAPAAAPEVATGFEPVEEAAPEAATEPTPAATSGAPRPDWPDEEGASLDLVTTGTFATETMAELCLEQGHDQEALAIFEQLLAQRPGDAALRGRVRALQDKLTPARAEEPVIGDFLRALAAREPDEAPAPTSVPDDVAADEDVADRDAWAAGAWTNAFRDRPLHDASDASQPDRASEASDPTVAEPDVDLSFDRFFAGQQLLAEAPSVATTVAPEPSAVARDDAAVSGDAESADDLEDFNAWLRGLRDA